MATAAELSAIQAAINSLRGGSAYETPFSEDVALRLAPVAQSTGFMSAGAFLEAVKNNPLSTLLQWSVALAGSGGMLSGAGAPAVAPDFVGQLYHNTTADTYYRSTGLTSADWVAIGATYQDMQVAWEPPSIEFGNKIGYFTYSNIPGITKLEFLGSTMLAGFDIESLTDLAELSAPNLTSVDLLNLHGGFIYCSNNPALVVFNVSLVTYISYQFSCRDNISLTSLNLSNLVTVGDALNISGNTALSTLNVSSWIPTNGTFITISNNALNTTSVEQILRRCVLAGVTTCTINLSGGTNAGVASLNAQGQADVVTLGAQLTINA